MSCPDCSDRGIILIDGEAVRCQCVLHRAKTERLIETLPPLLRTHTFDTFSLEHYLPNIADRKVPTRSVRDTAEVALREAQRFVTDFLCGRAEYGLLFTGGVGSGKTFLAAAIVNAIVVKDGAALFVVVPDFLDRIRATYTDRDDVSERDLVEQAKNIPLLVLDDLGAHQYTEWSCQKIYSILNYRLNHMLPVIVTTNLDLEDIKNVLGMRTFSRLCQMCKTIHLEAYEDIRITIRMRQKQTVERTIRVDMGGYGRGAV